MNPAPLTPRFPRWRGTLANATLQAFAQQLGPIAWLLIRQQENTMPFAHRTSLRHASLITVAAGLALCAGATLAQTVEYTFAVDLLGPG